MGVKESCQKGCAFSANDDIAVNTLLKTAILKNRFHRTTVPVSPCQYIPAECAVKLPDAQELIHPSA